MKSVNFIVGITLTGVALIGVFALYLLHFRQEVEPENVEYDIEESWMLPPILDEVSGIALLDDGLVACVQDEMGVIYVYDFKKRKLVQEVKFTEPGDFEALVVKGEDAYVMRSDGLLYEVLGFRNSEPTAINTYDTGLSDAHNLESLAWSADGKSLLTLGKDKDELENFKLIHAFDLESKKMQSTGFARIPLQDQAFKIAGKKDSYRSFNPSEMAVANDGIIYVLDGINPKIILIDPKGEVIRSIRLSRKDFPQPEGMAILSKNTLLIASEAAGGNAVMRKIVLHPAR